MVSPLHNVRFSWCTARLCSRSTAPYYRHNIGKRFGTLAFTHVHLSDILGLKHRFEYGVGPTLAAIPASTVLGRLSRMFRSVIVEISTLFFFHQALLLDKKARLSVSILIHLFFFLCSPVGFHTKLAHPCHYGP